MAKILIVDDEKSICFTIEVALQHQGHQVRVAHQGQEAIELLNEFRPDILLTDLRMEGMTGLDLLHYTREYLPSVTIVMMTAFGTVDSAVAAMKNGAYDYLVKPFTVEQLEHLIDRIQEYRHLIAENTKLRDQVDALSEPTLVQTKNPKMLKVLDHAQKVALTDSSVLISGENGTGKTLLARFIHKQSSRNQKPFVTINCATLSEALLEKELFGYSVDGPGGVKDKVGRLQLADQGTVFFDQIGEVSASLQAKLLRLLKEKEFEPVGSTQKIRVNVRVIATTDRNLLQEAKAGRFREDLYFHLNAVDLNMPSLRQRPEDILTLAEQFLNRALYAAGFEAKPLSEAAKKAMLTYRWPGNVHELKNVLERAAAVCTGTEIQVGDLPDRLVETKPDQPASPDASLEELEKQHIRSVLSSASTLEEAASILGINLSTLWRKRRRYSLD